MNEDTVSPFYQYAAHQEVLRERLSYILESLNAPLKVDVERALSDRGKLLFQADVTTPGSLPSGNWALLPLLLIYYVSPAMNSVVASSVGVAVECYVCALDLLDDVEDEDQTPIVKELGVARVLNVSTTLLMMTQQALLSLEQEGIPPERILRLLTILQTCTLVATTGQHRDLLAEHRLASDMTQEECIEIAASKAGAIMRFACLVGPVLAEANETLCTLFAEMGELLGIAHQLDNDSHDLYYLLQGQSSTRNVVGTESTPQSVKSDLARGKKTLPVVLAAHSERMLQEKANSTDESSEGYQAALQEGIITTWGLCLLYRERARDCLQKIEAQKPVTPGLRFLLGFE